MNNEPSSAPDLTSLEIDLAQSFVPAWAKESDALERMSRLAEQHGDQERPARPGKHAGSPRTNRGPRPDRSRGPGGHRPNPRSAPSSLRQDRRPNPPPRPAPELSGWDVYFKPDPRGVDAVTKQIKSSVKAYALFDLAWLVLDKPERYQVELKRLTENAPALFQLKLDGSVWLNEREAMTQALTQHLEKFYRRERVAVEPPKGSYPFVARCGLSGLLLGPPNYHNYQSKLHQLHTERFAHLPLDVYKSRIQMMKDEASIQQWKEEQSWKDEFYPVETPEGTEPVRLETFAAVEHHFREHQAGGAIELIRHRVLVPGPAALQSSTATVRQLVRRAVEELQRFPLPLVHTLGKQLTAQGLQIFKAHKNITYVSVNRPHYLDYHASSVSEGLRAMLAYLETHASTPRADQWKALVALRPMGTGTEADPESAVAADLTWLLREGYLIDYAGRSLEVTPRPKPRPAVVTSPQPSTPSSTPNPAPHPINAESPEQ